jgi:hypothetical protein
MTQTKVVAFKPDEKTQRWGATMPGAPKPAYPP